MTKAIEAGIFDEEIATDADYRLKKAVQEVKKLEPNKKTILEHLSSVETITKGVTAASGLVTALAKAGELVERLF
jgi:hypothetical protein